MISIVIPTLNEALCIGKTLTHLSNARGDIEILVVDGGSIDETENICRGFDKVHYIQMTNGQRARQMNLGASAAKGDFLLFLHADTLPPDDFVMLIHKALSRKKAIGGAFSIQFDVNHWMLNFTSRLTRLNIVWITFGDHGIFLRTADFRRLNGFTEMPILEDLELLLRMKSQGVLVRPKASVCTSARRFVNNGIFRQTFQDFIILFGYFIGISPVRLARLYSNKAEKAR